MHDMRCFDPTHVRDPIQTYRSGETDFLTCVDCGLRFRKRFPNPTELDEIYETAFAQERIEGDATDQASGDYADERYFRYLNRHFTTRNMRVFDFGAGTGSLLSRFQKGHIDATGIEYSAAARAYCFQRHGIKLLAPGDDIPNDTFDLITLIEVIEHLTDLWSVLTTIRAALKNGGTLFLTTPSATGLRAILQNGHWAEAQKKFHLILFDWQSIRHHLTATGFKNIRRIRFPPTLKPGIGKYLYARATQSLGIGGTLCVTAQKI